MSKIAVIAQDCQQCVGFYRENPGLAGTDTMIDLYETIARLARVVEEQQRQIDSIAKLDPIEC